MASANTIRRALIKLLQAGDENAATPNRNIYAPDQVRNPGAVLGSTDDNLRSARQQAKEVQGVDPLAAKQGRQDIQGSPSPTRASDIDDPIENLEIREEAATDITNLAPYGSEVPGGPARDLRQARQGSEAPGGTSKEPEEWVVQVESVGDYGLPTGKNIRVTARSEVEARSKAGILDNDPEQQNQFGAFKATDFDRKFEGGSAARPIDQAEILPDDDIPF
jgi:hypothetical protein